MELRVITVADLADVSAHLERLADDAIVCAVPPGADIVDSEAVLAAYDTLAAPIVLAASPGADGEALPVDVPTPYRRVGPALIGRVRALRTCPDTSAKALARAYLDGADLDLDIGAEIFLVRDGTRTDALRIGSRVVATATGTRPGAVIGGIDDLDDAADQSLDLARLFAYDDAMAPGCPLSVVGPDIISTAFWTPGMCRSLIRAAEAAAAWGSDPDDPVPGSEISLAALDPVLFAHVDAHLEHIVVPQWREQWPEIAWTGLHDVFVIKYVAAGDSRALPIHHDVAQISGSVRLNAGYEGGALEFPRQGWSNAATPVGDLVAWPSLVTHPHRSAPVTRGVKYALTIWCSLPR